MNEIMKSENQTHTESEPATGQDAESLPDSSASEDKLPQSTDRLKLRRFNPSDSANVRVLFDDREIASNTRTLSFPFTQKDAEEWLAKHQHGWETGEGFVFAIEQRSDNALAGAIGLHVNQDDHQAELGYTLGRQFWGQGYCTEAAKSIVEYGFEEIGLHKITSHHLARNPASGRVLQKIGMTHEGTFRGHVRKWGVFEDVKVYGMLVNDPREN